MSKLVSKCCGVKEKEGQPGTCSQCDLKAEFVTKRAPRADKGKKRVVWMALAVGVESTQAGAPMPECEIVVLDANTEADACKAASVHAETVEAKMNYIIASWNGKRRTAKVVLE